MSGLLEREAISQVFAQTVPPHSEPVEKAPAQLLSLSKTRVKKPEPLLLLLEYVDKTDLV